MVTNLPSCFSIQFLEKLLKFLVNFTLLKYFKSQRSYGFLTTKELIFGFQILDLKDHFSASLREAGLRLSITICFTKMKEDNISQLGDYDGPFCEQTIHARVLLCLFVQIQII